MSNNSTEKTVKCGRCGREFSVDFDPPAGLAAFCGRCLLAMIDEADEHDEGPDYDGPQE